MYNPSSNTLCAKISGGFNFGDERAPKFIPSEIFATKLL